MHGRSGKLPLVLFLAFVAALCIRECFAGPPQSKADLDLALRSGQLSYRFTEPPEVITLFGEPEKTEELREGEMTIQLLRYPGSIFAFGKRRDTPTPFVLVGIEFQGQRLDIGQNRKIAPRNEQDLAKLDAFFGFQNLSLVRVDLSNQRELIDKMSFDSATEWPPAEKLPPGFDPAERLRSGLNPGLGIRKLHAKAIDGRGIYIAIIDQPLIRDHVEYRHAIMSYELIGVDGVPPQMHGPAVASIAVGKNRGVAPGARLAFFAVPMWKPDNQPYIDAIRKILTDNQEKPESEKIRVVSISTGMFPQQAHHEDWLSILKEAEAGGVFVVTCDPAMLPYGGLVRLPGQDPDDPGAYRAGRYRAPGAKLLVPTGNLTRASQAGPESYAFDPEGGLSWAAPYIGGLAALAYQVNPKLSPAEIRDILVRTAVMTSAGPVINPLGFIAEIQKR